MAKQIKGPLAVVEIGYHELLLPLTKATQLVEILGQGAWVDGSYEAGGMRYSVKADQERFRVGLQVVRPDQITTPAGDARVVHDNALGLQRTALAGPTRR